MLVYKLEMFLIKCENLHNGREKEMKRLITFCIKSWYQWNNDYFANKKYVLCKKCNNILL